MPLDYQSVRLYLGENYFQNVFEVYAREVALCPLQTRTETFRLTLTKKSGIEKTFFGLTVGITEEEGMELICIHVSKPKIEPFIVCTCYRPPSSTIETMNKFEVILHKLDSYHMEVDIIGDINCNVSATPPHFNAQKLLDICDIHQYSQLIDQPTRITQHTSCIMTCS